MTAEFEPIDYPAYCMGPERAGRALHRYTTCDGGTHLHRGRRARWVWLRYGVLGEHPLCGACKRKAEAALVAAAVSGEQATPPSEEPKCCRCGGTGGVPFEGDMVECHNCEGTGVAPEPAAPVGGQAEPSDGGYRQGYVDGFNAAANGAAAVSGEPS